MASHRGALTLTAATHCSACGGTADHHEPGCSDQADRNRRGIERARRTLRRTMMDRATGGAPPERPDRA